MSDPRRLEDRAVDMAKELEDCGPDGGLQIGTMTPLYAAKIIRELLAERALYENAQCIRCAADLDAAGRLGRGDPALQAPDDSAAAIADIQTLAAMLVEILPPFRAVEVASWVTPLFTLTLRHDPAVTFNDVLSDLIAWNGQHPLCDPLVDDEPPCSECQAIFDRLMAAGRLGRGDPALPDHRCTCWIGRGSTFGSSSEREACPFHGALPEQEPT